MGSGKLQVKRRVETSGDRFQRQIALRKAKKARQRVRWHRVPSHRSTTTLSFFELGFGQKVLALFGMPVEFGTFYHWRSWMTLVLLASNIAVFGIMVVHADLGVWIGLFPDAWLRDFAFTPSLYQSDPTGMAYTGFTSMFMHAGIVHLVGNLCFLFVVGDDVEQHLGPIPFLLFYVGAGLVSTAVSYHIGLYPELPHLGASGAISGVMGAYLVLCRHKFFHVWLFKVFIFGRMISVPVWAYLGFWFAAQFVLLHWGERGVDYWAHIGGFGAGLFVGVLLLLTKRDHGS